MTSFQNPFGKRALGGLHGNLSAADHSGGPGRSLRFDTSSTPSAGRSDAARRAADPGLSDESPGDDPESARHGVSEQPVPVRSILHLDEDRVGLDVRPNGLFLPEGISFDSWRALGSRVALVATCSAWWLGDWLIYGEQAYGDRYEQAIVDTSLGYQTLRNYAWVARKFPVSRRRDGLSFGHHAEVAALPDDEQDAWLTRAEQSDWSRNQLRRRLRAAASAKHRASGDEGLVDTAALKIDVPAGRRERWESAARQKKSSMADWIIATLDRAANEQLMIGTTPAQPPPSNQQ